MTLIYARGTRLQDFRAILQRFGKIFIFYAGPFEQCQTYRFVLLPSNERNFPLFIFFRDILFLLQRMLFSENEFCYSVALQVLYWCLTQFTGRIFIQFVTLVAFISLLQFYLGCVLIREIVTGNRFCFVLFSYEKCNSIATDYAQ